MHSNKNIAKKGKLELILDNVPITSIIKKEPNIIQFGSESSTTNSNHACVR